MASALATTLTMALVSALMSCSPPAAVVPAPGPSSAGGVDVAFVGDSITAGGFWQQAFPHRSITNHGVSGDTSSDVIARLPAIRAGDPRTYLLMVGINDILKGSAPEAIASRILTISRALRTTPGTRVVIQSVLPCQRSRCGTPVLQRVDELNRLLAERTPPADFLDLRPAFSDASGGLDPGLTDDGLHLNSRGYARWQDRLASSLDVLSPVGEGRDAGAGRPPPVR